MQNFKTMNKRFLVPGVILSILILSGLAQGARLLAAKPGSVTPLSDEQQGILAVRTVKASVVDIVGVTAPQNSSSSQASIADQDAVYGTGFVLDSDGMIVSNNHVVSDPTMNYTVILPDGSEYPAKILDLDKFDDIALLQVNAQNLVPAQLGDSSALETGQSVFAIGNSLGQYQYTVTRGVVSALGRSVDVADDSGQDSRLHNLIQTDAAINPGNSGGPLINLSGQVIGMNTLIDAGGAGLGFAIPVNTIKDAVQQIKTFGKVSRPFLGVEFLNIDPAAQITQGLSVNSGALVSAVVPGSPAAVAGLQPGDIITSVNGSAITPNQSLDDSIDSFQAGAQVTLTVTRGSGTLQLQVILGEQM